jgi:hypothetical protein
MNKTEPRFIRTKIFFGSNESPADEQVNSWLKNQQDIEIIDFKYQLTRFGYHSICVIYKMKVLPRNTEE